MGRRALALVTLGFALLAGSTLLAQQGGASVRGKITDQQGSVLPGATIALTHLESGVVRETVSGSEGAYLAPGIVPGPYKIVVELLGFSRVQREDLVVR